MVNLVMVQFGLTDFDISVIGMGDFYSRDCDFGMSDINVRFGLVNFAKNSLNSTQLNSN